MSSSISAAKNKGIDMTQGNIARHIVVFALPLVLGNLCQQLYTLADTWVVGNFVGDDAFSAIGAVSPIIKLMINIFTGFTSGAGVVLSQIYGSGDREGLKDASHTAVTFFALTSLGLTAVSVLAIPLMLRLIAIPEELYDMAYEYLLILFAFISFSATYNMGSAILRSVGDSRKPFVFLVVTAIFNVGLDLLFVIVFDWGIAGAAYATIISQAIAAILTIRELLITSTPVKIYLKELHMNPNIIRKIIKLGIPYMLQFALVQLSVVMVVNYMSDFGKAFLGGYTVYSKLDQLLFMTGGSLGIATSTFVGQNIGAGKPERAKQCVKVSLCVNLSIWATACILFEIFAPNIVYFFNKSPEIIAYGTTFIRICTPFFGMQCFAQVYTGVLQGLGNTRTPSMVTIMTSVVIRQVYLYVVTHFLWNTEVAVMICFPISWVFSCFWMIYLGKKAEYKSHI